MKQTEIEEVLSNLMSFDLKDWTYKLMVHEHPRLREVTAYIIKYNYVKYLDEINLVVQADNIAFREDPKGFEIKIMIKHCIIYDSRLCTWDMWRTDKEKIFGDLYIGFLRHLDFLAHGYVKRVELRD